MISLSTTVRFRRNVGLMLLLLTPVFASAEDTWAEQQGFARTQTYQLGVDDVISVQELYQLDFSVEEATVRPDGRISVPVTGDIAIIGRTPEEVAAEITEALPEELHEPRASVRLLRGHVEPIYVLGAVRAPGAVQTRESLTVAEAVALAQGLSATAAPRWAVLIGADGHERQIDVLEALQECGEAAPRIAPGETLLVGAQYLVTIVGRVNTPGRYSAEEGDRVADAFAAAGGTLDDAAAAGTLVRADGTMIELDLDALLDRADAQANMALLRGDTIVIPRASRRVALVGAFVEPGKYDFDPGDRVSDALALARDVDRDALTGSALLLRSDGASQRVDLEALLQVADGAEDPEFPDGDTLVLPRATDRIAVVGMVENPGPMLLTAQVRETDAGADLRDAFSPSADGDGVRRRFAEAGLDLIMAIPPTADC